MMEQNQNKTFDKRLKLDLKRKNDWKTNGLRKSFNRSYYTNWLYKQVIIIYLTNLEYPSLLPLHFFLVIFHALSLHIILQ